MMKRNLKGSVEGNTKRKPLVTWNDDESPPSLLRREVAASLHNRPSRRDFQRNVDHSARGSAPSRIEGSSIRPILLTLLAIVVVGVVTFGAVIGYRNFFLQADKSPYLLPPRTVVVSVPELTVTPNLSVTYHVKKGDTLSEIAQRLGFSHSAAVAVDDAIKKLSISENSKISLRVGQKIQIAVDSEDGIREILLPLDRVNNIVVRLNPDGSYVADRETIVRPQTEHFAVGIISTSFAAAAKDAGVSYSVVDDLVDLFSDRVVFHQDFRVGDRFSIIYRDEGTGKGVGPILAAALQVNGEELIAARFVGSDGKARYFNEKGQLLGNSFLRYPLQFSRISSYFSFARFHPILRRFRPHNGVDFAAAVGTPVRSVASGKVIFAGRNGPSGIMVKIQHSDRYSTAYLHLSKIAGGISKGASVAQGDIIGAVGQTGSATGPHLHYSFYDNGKYVDPLKIRLPYLEDLHSGTKISESYLKRVLFTLRHYQDLDLNKLYTGQGT